MGIYVTEHGLKRKTLQEIRTELETSLKAVFGVSFETSVDSPNGLLISQMSATIASHWELAEEVFNSRDPGQATGVALDFAAVLTGIIRRQQTACRVTATLYTENASASIPAGSLAEMSRGNKRFSLDSAVQINRATCSEVIINTSDFTGEEITLEFTFGTVHVTLGQPPSLWYAIELAGGIPEYVPDGIRVTHSSGTVGVLGSIPSGVVVLAGNPGNFTAAETGDQTCETGELDTVVSDVAGWDKVYNYEPGIPGTNYESDAALRIRRRLAAHSIKGSGTDPAIASHLMEEVEGVTSAKVTSNRTMTTDAQGRPPKSFEALVVGGEPEDVARVIWENMPSGMQCYGNTSQEITDEDGDAQMIFFSRPVPEYLWIKLTYHLYDEENAPTSDEIKEAIANWAEGEYTIGKDVIPERVLAAIYPPKLNGIGQASVEVAVTDESYGVTPTYTSNTIPIGPNYYAAFSVGRITLVDVT